ncbi:dipeptidase [Pilimelia columellifera]|uniref:Dipeptidase n=1 Tax=Pilimelia columellifera subsp. columellifera TaxID=706583 RepID=A0ABN3NHD1_9ACTN
MEIARVRALLQQAPVFDGHNDLAWEMRLRAGYDHRALDLAADQSCCGLHTDLPRLAAGGVGAQWWSVWVPDDGTVASPVAATLEQIDFVRGWAAANPGRMALATTADDVERARAAGRIACLIGMEGGHSIGGSLAVLRMMHALGARYLTLTHVRNTPWADSATDVPAAGGLTDFGHDVVRELNRLGMLVDLSHVAPATMHDALDTSTAPAFFSHSNALAMCAHPRNVPDDVLRRVRDTDGIVMATFVPWFLTEPSRDWLDEVWPEYQRLLDTHPLGGSDFMAARRELLRHRPAPPCGAVDVADHLDYLRETVGVRGVGLGGDFDGVPFTPFDLPDVASYPTLLAELARRGWSDAELRALTWDNALRVLRDTESAARASR